MNVWVTAVFFVYMLGLLMLGAAGAGRADDACRYFFGYRRLRSLAAAFCSQTSSICGALIIAIPGYVYAYGAGKAWVAIGLFLGAALNWFMVSGRLHDYTMKTGAITVPEFLSRRFRDERHILKTISAVIIIIFFLIYTAAAFSAGARLISVVINIDYRASLVIGAAVILVCTALGGFTALARADFISGIIMVIVILAVPIVAVMLMGTGYIIPNLIDSGLDVSARDFLDIFTENGKPISPVSVISQLSWGLGYFGMPQILVRFMAVKDDKELAKAGRISVVWVLTLLAVACIIGVIGRAYLYPDVLGASGKEYLKVLAYMTQKIFFTDTKLYLIGGIFLGCIAAGLIQTAGAPLLTAASAVTDIGKNRASVRLGRTAVAVIGVLAVLMAWSLGFDIFTLASTAWAAIGSAFGPVILLSLYWKRTNASGAAAGMISGTAAVIIWDFAKFIRKNGEFISLHEYTGVYSVLIGFLTSALFIVIFSILTTRVSDEILKEFDDVKNGI